MTTNPSSGGGGGGGADTTAPATTAAPGPPATDGGGGGGGGGTTPPGPETTPAPQTTAPQVTTPQPTEPPPTNPPPTNPPPTNPPPTNPPPTNPPPTNPPTTDGGRRRARGHLADLPGVRHPRGIDGAPRPDGEMRRIPPQIRARARPIDPSGPTRRDTCHGTPSRANNRAAVAAAPVTARNAALEHTDPAAKLFRCCKRRVCRSWSAVASSSSRPTSPSCPRTRSAWWGATAPARPACSRCSAGRPSRSPAGWSARAASATFRRTPAPARTPTAAPRCRHILSGRGIDDRDRAHREAAHRDGGARRRAGGEPLRPRRGAVPPPMAATPPRARRGAIGAGLGLGGDRLDRPVGVLSGGERRRVELARILFAGSDVLCLDEPTNHLDIDAKEWLLGLPPQLSRRAARDQPRPRAARRGDHPRPPPRSTDRGGSRPHHRVQGHLLAVHRRRAAEDEKRLTKLAARQAKEIVRMQSRRRPLRGEGDQGGDGPQHGEAHRPARSRAGGQPTCRQDVARPVPGATTSRADRHRPRAASRSPTAVRTCSATSPSTSGAASACSCSG